MLAPENVFGIAAARDRSDFASVKKLSILNFFYFEAETHHNYQDIYMN